MINLLLLLLLPFVAGVAGGEVVGAAGQDRFKWPGRPGGEYVLHAADDDLVCDIAYPDPLVTDRVELVGYALRNENVPATPSFTKVIRGPGVAWTYGATVTWDYRAQLGSDAAANAFETSLMEGRVVLRVWRGTGVFHFLHMRISFFIPRNSPLVLQIPTPRTPFARPASPSPSPSLCICVSFIGASLSASPPRRSWPSAPWQGS